nr:MAG: FMN reductase (NADPH) [Leptolyngbya sp. IPPAS B-1204]
MANVVAIAGSPSHPSRSYAVLEYTKQLLEASAISTHLFSVRDLPPEILVFAQYNDSIIEIVSAIEQADALIIATPVYKASYTGVLKAFLDLLPQNVLSNKPVLPIATGGTIAHLLAIDYALKPVLSALGARHILAGVYLVDSQIQRHESGELQFTDTEAEQRLNRSVEELIQVIRPTPALVRAGQ